MILVASRAITVFNFSFFPGPVHPSSQTAPVAITVSQHLQLVPLFS